jgi:outer membrane murein-binding lipoprotein Lpp
MRRLLLPSVVGALLLIAGCASVPPPPDEAQQVAMALANYAHLSGQKAEEQRREFNAALTAHERAANDTTRLNLALAMLLPHAPWRDDARVQLLLNTVEVAPGEKNSPRRNLARLLLAQVAERQRAQRDEQRKAEQLATQLREERRKLDEVQQKIDSLRAIDRETRPPRKGP